MLVTLAIFAYDYLFRDETLTALLARLYILPLFFLAAIVYVSVDRQDKKGQFTIAGWKWVFYVIGCLGFINFVFWVFAYGIYKDRRKEGRSNVGFFGPQFQSMVFIWGVWMCIVIPAIITAVIVGMVTKP